MGGARGPSLVNQTSFAYTATKSIFTFDAASDTSSSIKWSNGLDDGVAYHKFALAQPRVFREKADMARWGDWYFGTTAGDGVTYRTGHSDTVTRERFIGSGRLDNMVKEKFGSIGDQWPVFAFSHDLGFVFEKKNVLFTIGLAQQQVIKFQGSGTGPESLDSESQDALILDSNIHNNAYAIGGQNYASLTTLAVRQAFGSLQVAQGSRQAYLFIKEISSDGDIQTVDVIFPAHPIFLYLNPELLKLLLDPLFEHQESGHYPNPWSIHDLGLFPNAVGFPDGKDEAMPIEECSNMIIMTLAYALRSGNRQYLVKHWTLLNQWAQFLVNDSLIPAHQLSTDDFAGALANQTNLALKGIIGVRAMAEIAGMSGMVNANELHLQYLKTSTQYIQDWTILGINNATKPPHATLTYNLPDTYGLLYNIYADRLLNLDFVPEWVYTMQSNFYQTILGEYGIPLDTRRNWAKSDWQAFAAAVAEPDVQNAMHERLTRFVEGTPTVRPLTDLYDVTTGQFPMDGPSFINRPVLGAFFALLALPQQ
ncbi:MAG: hypothetical protein SEPTF4163_003382 [Sporothrix epigloea]